MTTASLIGLAAGLIVGAAVQGVEHRAVTGAAEVTDTIAAVWLSALCMTILPLIVTHLVTAVLGAPRGEAFGRLGLGALLVFLGLHALATVMTLTATPLLLTQVTIDPKTVSALGERVAETASRLGSDVQPTSLGDWLLSLVPANPIQAAANGELLPVLLFTLLFALAATRLGDDQRRRLHDLFAAFADAMLVLVRWILIVTPLGVFALAFGLARETGLEAATMLGWFVVIVCGLLLAFTIGLYPLAILLGRANPRRFVVGAAPAQLVAVGTRSSIASLPAMLTGATRSMRVPQEIAGFALPLSVSVFKVNRLISSSAKLLFLAHVYGVDLSAAAIATFVASVAVLSVGSAGLPGGGGAFKTLPVYLAAGVPIEGVIILETVDAIPDVFKTLVNVTADLSVAVILARIAGRSEREMPSSTEPVAAGGSEP